MLLAEVVGLGWFLANYHGSTSGQARVQPMVNPGLSYGQTVICCGSTMFNHDDDGDDSHYDDDNIRYYYLAMMVIMMTVSMMQVTTMMATYGNGKYDDSSQDE